MPGPISDPEQAGSLSGPEVTRRRAKWGEDPNPRQENRGGGRVTTGRLPCLDVFGGDGRTWVMAAGPWFRDTGAHPQGPGQPHGTRLPPAFREGP